MSISTILTQFTKHRKNRMFEKKPLRKFNFFDKSPTPYIFSEFAPAEVTIIRSILPSKGLFLHKIRDTLTGYSHEACYMGQILFSLGFPTLNSHKEPVRLVSDVSPPVHKFTFTCRDRTIPTPEAARIMSLKICQQSEITINSLLPQGLTARFVDNVQN